MRICNTHIPIRSLNILQVLKLLKDETIILNNEDFAFSKSMQATTEKQSEKLTFQYFQRILTCVKTVLRAQAEDTAQHQFIVMYLNYKTFLQ